MDDKDQQIRLIPQDYRSLTLDADFPNGLSNALWVGSDGNVAVVTSKGTTIIIPGVIGGTYLLGQFIRVNTSGTSVTSPTTNILVVY